MPTTKVKDSVFSDLFGNKHNLLLLYRVLHPEDTDATEDDIRDVTIKNVLVKNLYNDLGFTVRGALLILAEAQATWNVNITYRLLVYLVETWTKYVKVSAQDPYDTAPLDLPDPEFFVVFTGERKGRPLKISLAKELSLAKRKVDLEVTFIYCSEEEAPGNILNQYIMFSREIDRQFKAKGRTIEAVVEAIKVCQQKNILKEYLTQQKQKEVIGIMDTLLNQEYMDALAVERGERRGEKRGEKRGERKGVFKTLYELVRDNLLSLANAASKAGQSEEEFAAGMEAYFAQAAVAK